VSQVLNQHLAQLVPANHVADDFARRLDDLAWPLLRSSFVGRRTRRSRASRNTADASAINKIGVRNPARVAQEKLARSQRSSRPNMNRWLPLKRTPMALPTQMMSIAAPT
jgi:hypothetical protein